ncbi:MAG: prepilin-type N-terminal cleavage/methylation domain-containing protein [Proteobacteria bacterium]|nr:prepilin-type N-terminal cleavage/methylation domain-containing protein [Pseudomonadota bacterium]
MILPSSRSHKRLSRGFTLIEVMVVVAIIGILAAIAYPSYRDYVIRGALVDATNGLSAVRADMEKHFQDNRTYASVGAFTSPCLRAGGIVFGDFVVNCSVAPDINGYTLAATGTAGTNVAGFVFTVTQADVRATTAAPTGWPTCATRWLTKKGQPCV